MAENIIMPKSGMAMEEGKIIRWLKKEGDPVEKGEALLEIETDKVTMEIESESSGTLLRIMRQEGDTVPVTEVIGIIGKEGEQQDEVPPVNTPPQPVKGLPAQSAVRHVPSGINEKTAATPLARAIAREKGIDLRQITGSGTQGEVRGRDVSAYIAGINGNRDYGTVLKEDAIKTDENINGGDAAGLVASTATRIQGYAAFAPVLNAKADVTEILELKKRLNDAPDMNVTIDDIVIKSVSLALRLSPGMNVRQVNGRIATREEINIGITVETDEGTHTPVIKNADRLTLKQISVMAAELAKKAREKKLSADDSVDGSLTVCNLGPYGIESFMPVLKPPECAMLGICAVKEEPALDKNGIIYRKNAMGLSLAFDHRSIGWAQAAAFLKRIVELLEDPIRILIFNLTRGG